MGNQSKQTPVIPTQDTHAFRDRIQKLCHRALEGEDSQSLAELMGLDSTNLVYFLELFEKFTQRKSEAALHLWEPGKPEEGHVLYPSAVAPEDLLKELPLVQYDELKTMASELRPCAKSAILWAKKMHAGTGSSILRESYLRDRDREVMGAKGTDLFVEIAGQELSLAELQVLRLIKAYQRGEFGGILFHDIVSEDTRQSVSEIWSLPCRVTDGQTYGEFVEKETRLGRSGETLQSKVPTIDSQGHLSYHRVAPGGHGLFAVDAILCGLEPDRLPDTGANQLVASISNGEDLSASPDDLMVGWMVSNRIPIAMVTTTKTPTDMKGGQLALEKENGALRVVLVERAQAEVSGQLEYFENLGLREGDSPAFFNTNMVLVNYAVLVPLLTKLRDKVGETELISKIGPDLICNGKSQVEADGATREYIQLEGAMGSVFLNLDRLWRSHFPEPLVHFINVSEWDRTAFFAPVKTPLDFFMQFYSDRFRLDVSNFKLKDLRPGHLPRFHLTGSSANPDYYSDLSTVLDAFEGTSLLGLDSLKISGEVNFGGAILEGSVEIDCRVPGILSEIADLPRVETRVRLENVRVEIAKTGAKIRPFELA